jgi:DNA-binding transcriptional ArsR family regulator
MTNDLDQIWKALADETRRTILDFLRLGPKPTTAIVEQFPDLSRFAVMKHLDVLRQAALVVTREEGRQRINSLNAVPIRMIYERWVSKYEDLWASTLLRVKEAAERNTAVSSPVRAAKNSEGKRKRRKTSRTHK